MTTQAKEIPFPLPKGRRDPDPHASAQEEPGTPVFKGIPRPVGVEAKAKCRDAIKEALLPAAASNPPWCHQLARRKR